MKWTLLITNRRLSGKERTILKLKNILAINSSEEYKPYTLTNIRGRRIDLAILDRGIFLTEYVEELLDILRENLENDKLNIVWL